MPSTYTSSGIELIADGEQSGLWGQTTNTNLEIINRMIAEAGSISLSGTTHTLTISDGILSDGQYAALVFGGSPSGTNTVTINPNDAKRIFFVINSSGQSVVLTQGSGGNVTILNGDSKIVYTDGAGASAKVTDITDNFAMGSVNIDGGTIDGVTLGTNSAVTEAQIDNININGNAITSTDTNGNIALTPNGTGEVDISKVDINSGTIDGTVIGGSTPAAISGTTGTFSGNLTVDTNTLFVDAASNNVGIGTTSPAAKLEVRNDSAGASVEVARLANNGVGANTKARLNFFAASTNYGAITGGFGASAPEMTFDIIGGTHGNFIWTSASTERMRIDSSGNVGVGTSSPTGKLHISRAGGSAGSGNLVYVDVTSSFGGITINASSGNNAFLELYENGTKTGAINSDATANVTSVQADNSHALAFNTGGTTERMRINAAGDVGIGTSSPVQKLDVSTGGIASTDTSGNARSRFEVFTNGQTNNQITLGQGFAGPTDNVGYLYNRANAAFVFGTNNTERMRIDSSGNVGIGTSTGIDAPLTFAGSVGKKISLYSGSDYSIGIESSELRLATSGFMSFYRSGFSGSESMRIDSSGNLLVGTTTAGGNGGLTVIPNGSVGAAQLQWDRVTSTSSTTALVFFNADVSSGGITYNNTSTSFVTSSDYRLKEDVQPMVGASDRLMALKPVNFAWKVNGSRTDGFLAHEAQEVVPEAVTGEKDAVDKDGKPQYQGIDQSKLVPLLTAALQEALTEIADLKARVAALEA